MRVGFFDSGVGGVTVLAEALKLLPNEDYIYYADTKHVPYGPKPKDQVKQYIFDAVDFLAGMGLKALVIACNTATSVAVKELRDRYSFPVIGMEPAVKPAVKNAETGRRVLVLATELTLKEAKYRDLVSAIDPAHIVDSMPMPELVELAEQLKFDDKYVLPCLEQKFASLDIAAYKTVVLGCTHFVFFRRSLRNVFLPQTDIIDGAAGTLNNLLNKLRTTQHTGGGSGDILFCSSAGSDDVTRLQRAFELAKDI